MQKYPDPTALGLFGLAMVTLVSSSQKFGLTEGFSYVIPWAVFLGALAQLVAGIMDFKRLNVFGGTASCAYGFFWLATATSWMISMGVFGLILREAVDPHQMGLAIVGYLIITLFFTIGAANTNKVLFGIFIAIDLLFVGLTVATFGPEGPLRAGFYKMAAWSELAIALLSFYGGGANILNTHLGRDVLPIGKGFGPFAKENDPASQ